MILEGRLKALFKESIATMPQCHRATRPRQSNYDRRGGQISRTGSLES